MIYTVKIEQTYHYPNRMKYIAQTDSFVEKDVKSLSYERNVRQPAIPGANLKQFRNGSAENGT